MPIDFLDFADKRPYLYHLTSRDNVPRIIRTRRLESAAILARTAGKPEILETRRPSHLTVIVDGEVVWLRDQAPLHAGNMALEDGWTFSMFVAHLNERVFFWPGTAQGPNAYGLRHFGRYVAEAPAILRIPTRALFAANLDGEFRFAKSNSGSPRWSRGIAPRRGASTFVLPEEATFRSTEVVEVTVLGSVALPFDTCFGNSPHGPWRSLE